MSDYTYYSYEDCIRLTGATIHASQSFGDYQGSSVALVTTADGRRGWLRWYYGSCSGCDHLESEMSGAWNVPDSEENAFRHAVALRVGAELVDGLTTAAVLLADYVKLGEWDTEADEAIAFIRAHDGGGT